MKKYIGKLIVAVLLTFTLNSNAQNNAADLSYVVKIDASADKIWEQVRKMDNIDKISSYVGSLQWIGPRGVGGIRICTAPDGKGKFKEKILKFDDQQRSYTWQVVEGIPAKNVINSFKIVDLGRNKS
ncbi:MAG: SRPBCC family protein, partial [Bacteroidota bacterium]